MITALVLYDLPETIGLEECRAHFAKIAPDFLRIPSASSSSAGATAKSPVVPICGRARRPPRRLFLTVG
jgi:hypothetical protein